MLSGSRFLAAGVIFSTWLAFTRGYRPTLRQWRDNALIGLFPTGATR